MLRLIICLAIIFCLADASVHKFLAKPHRLEGEAAAIRHNAIRNRRLQSIPEDLRNFESLSKLSPKLTLNRTTDSYWAYTANVTIGTPAAWMQIFRQNTRSIQGTIGLCDYFFWLCSSSTYVDKNGNFTDFPCGKGINGSDQIKVDDVSANVVLGVITDSIGYLLRYYPVDGVLGLNPTKPYSNADNLVSQLVGTMDTPVMSWWQNTQAKLTITRPDPRTAKKNTENVCDCLVISHSSVKKRVDLLGIGPYAQLTLGGEDTDNCQSNYVYASQQPSRRTTYGDYRVHIASAQIDQMTDYEVDCDLSKIKNIILNIGGTGDKADGTTKQLILTGADYVYYYKYYDACVVLAYPSEYAHTEELTRRFMNNHCVAYNAKEKTVGFADVKVKNNDPKTY
ncbi:hypothetical protein DdX_17188 [Ditylenchus destructor]|uniref:Uncharacterized protein n=1 Tax=Ditylenchus destructor TaxID=166010 RepID=A0AAD4MP13_9BILA|nr:hypothetical protein DdX_17188 [Ditylenchus destructor]